MSSVMPSGLVTVVTACPAKCPGKSRSCGFRCEKSAPAAAVGVSRMPDGATGWREPAGAETAARDHGLAISASAASRADGNATADLRDGIRVALAPVSATVRESLQLSRRGWYGGQVLRRLAAVRTSDPRQVLVIGPGRIHP